MKYRLCNENINMINNLYKDSANKQNSIVNAEFISFYKFHGEPIELLLKETIKEEKPSSFY